MRPKIVTSAKSRNPEFIGRVVSLFDQGWTIGMISREVDMTDPTLAIILRREGRDSSANKRVRKPKMPSYICSKGYRWILQPSHGNANYRGFVKEHILVATKALGRPIKGTEIVHHINGDKLDNRNTNLLICDSKYHAELHWRMGKAYQKEHFARKDSLSS